MYLKTLNIHNFRLFEDISIDFHPNLTVIAGVNGSGKTTILEAASIALSTMFVKMDGLSGRKIDKTQAHLKAYSVGSTKDVQAQYPVDISAVAVDDSEERKTSALFFVPKELRWTRSLASSKGQTLFGEAKDFTEFGITLQDKVRNGDTKVVLPLFAYYGTGRLWDYHREKQQDVFKSNNRVNGYVDCMDGTANIKLMMNWFMKMTIQKYQNQDLGLEEIPELEAVYAAMEACYRSITGSDSVKIQYSMGTKELEVVYKDDDGNTMRIPLNQLSDGYKSTISLVADIAYRMAVLNPQLLGDVCTKTDGIVLIDEVDLHLHPAWQQRVLSDLRSIFPKVQFIVTTHAVPVISSVKSENLRILDGQQIIPVNEQVFGNDANSLYQRIMRVPERDPETAEMFRKFDQLINNKQFDSAEALLNDIDERRDGHDIEVNRNRVKLKLERIRGGEV